MAKNFSIQTVIPLAAVVAGFLFLKNRNSDSKSATNGIGSVKKVLHWLQAVNNDYRRIKKEKWTMREIKVYCDDVGRRYVTPICFFNEAALKGSTYGNGDINPDSSALKKFLEYNAPFLLKEDDKSGMFSRMDSYNVFAILYSEKLEEMFGLD